MPIEFYGHHILDYVIRSVNIFDFDEREAGCRRNIEKLGPAEHPLVIFSQQEIFGVLTSYVRPDEVPIIDKRGQHRNANLVVHTVLRHFGKKIHNEAEKLRPVLARFPEHRQAAGF